MQLTQAQLEQLVGQAQRDAPNETCGIIGGKDGRADQIYPLANADDTPRVRYLAEPQALLEALRDIEDTRGGELLAIYHSHPASPGYPSPTDVERAFYPDAVYILISLMHPEAAQVRAFRIENAQVSEVTLDIVEEEAYEQARAPSRRHSPAARRPRANRAVAPLSKGRPRQRRVRPPRRRISK